MNPKDYIKLADTKITRTAHTPKTRKPLGFEIG